MYTRFLAVLGVVVASLAVATTGGLAADTTTTTTPTPTTTAAASNQSVTQTTTIQVSKTVTIEKWRYADGTFYVTVTAEVPRMLKVSDTGAVIQAMRAGSGASSVKIPSRTVYLENPGASETIQFRATNVDGVSAVTVASSHGAVLLRTGAVEGGRPAIPYGTVQGLLVGSMAFVAGLAVVIVRRRRQDDTPEVEQIA